MTPIKLKRATLKRPRLIPGLGDSLQTFEGPELVLLPHGAVHIGQGIAIPLVDFQEVVTEQIPLASPAPLTETDGPVQPQAAGGRPGRKRT